MADNIYGGITYPHTLYSIDKTYSNFTEAQSKASGDGVLIGRYVLIVYSSRALDQDEKNYIISTIKGAPQTYSFDSEEYNTYASNLMSDSNNNYNKLHSYDRHILRKKYDNDANKMVYEDIAILNSTLSDASIVVDAVDSGDKVLDLSNGILSSDITLEYKDRKIYLYGKDKEKEISSIDASDFIKDGMIKFVELTEIDGEGKAGKFLKIIWDTRELDDEDQTTYVDLTTLIDVYEAGNGIKVEENKISIKMDEASETKYLSLSEQGLKLTGITQLEEELDNKIQVTKKNTDMNEQATIQIVLDGTGIDIGLDQDFVTTDQVYMRDQIDEMFAEISTEAEQNVQADWNEENQESDAYIKNKPTKLSQFENDNISIETLGAVPNTRKINDKSLAEDITLTPGDIGAAAINDDTTEADTTYSSNKINSLLGDKVTIVPGKGLSTNDFTDAYKSKVDSALQSYTETDPTVPDWAKRSTKPTYTKTEIGLGNVADILQYSDDNPPPYPVTKVNNQTGEVTITPDNIGAATKPVILTTKWSEEYQVDYPIAINGPWTINWANGYGELELPEITSEDYPIIDINYSYLLENSNSMDEAIQAWSMIRNIETLEGILRFYVYGEEYPEGFCPLIIRLVR